MRHAVLVIIVGAIVLTGCGRPGFPASGTAGLDSIDTTVDSTVAEAYLDEYLDPDAADHAGGEPLDSIDKVLRRFDSRPLDTPTLVQLAHQTSNDFAALYFAERETSRFPQLKRSFLRYSRRPRSVAGPDKSYVVVFVPGLFYESNPETKSDLREAESIVRSLGIETDRVVTAEADTVEANARRIADFVLHHRDPERQLVLVSASKGGPEVLYALGALLDPDETKQVRAWVSVGGILRGSQVADYYLLPCNDWKVSIAGWWKGFSRDMIESLSTERSRRRFAASHVPEHITVLHYVGVPVSGSVTDPVEGPYEIMNPYGPSDGLTLLTDQLLDNGLVVTDLGLDHRFTDPRIAEKTAALTLTVLDVLHRENAEANLAR